MIMRPLFLLFLAAALSGAADRRLAPDIQGYAPEDTVRVIIRYRVAPQPRHRDLVTKRGGLHKATLDAINAEAFEVPASELADLANDPDVDYISPDRPVRGTLDYTQPAVNANIAQQYGYKGAGIGIAVIDSGVNPHPDLYDTQGRSRIVYSESFVAGDPSTDDAFGHGTHVAGIAAGDALSSTGPFYTRTFMGIAPQAGIVNLRVLDKTGVGTVSSVIAAIQRAIKLASKYNIRVINLSLGQQVFESYKQDPLCQAVEAAWKAGLVVVVAAGNGGRDDSAATNGYATIRSPGNDPYAITVGAMKTEGTVTRADDLIASYSSKGPTLIDHFVKPDLVAPGNRTVSLLNWTSYLSSTYPTNQISVAYYTKLPLPWSTPLYLRLSGTSMATPVVSGAAALLLDKEPSLTPDQVKARLMKTATKQFPLFSTAVDPATGISYTSQYDIFTVGAGYLDVWAALNNYDLAAKPALSPQVRYTNGTVSLVFPDSVVWGGSAVWGSSVVWGNQVLVGGSSAVWGSSVVWGSSTTQGFSVVWGNSAVWGSSQQTPSLSILVNGEN